MTVQVAVRIPDDMAAFIDAHTTNRTAYILAALERERRRILAESDIRALAAADDSDAAAVAGHAARTPLDVD
ncbi:antitoxin [Nocardia sp. NPDC052112]|uniref:antitoxin n=1 Tax=Nocardia sp. NPDC052112 TaxID=3155646 RepID=UPI00341CCEDD